MNLLILLYLLIISPKLFVDRVFKKKSHPGLLQRLGLKIPKVPPSAIWIHAVSVGEVKAAGALLPQIRKKKPSSFILVTTTTRTGQEEAKRSLKADAYAYLPLDLSPIVNRWIKKVNPEHFILVESDIWPNLLKALSKNGTQVSFVSAKMSERSAKRFHFFLPFSKKIFSNFDQICLQDRSYLPRFSPLFPSLRITGNLKLDLSPEPTAALKLPSAAITISCTHPGEEALLLEALLPGPYFLLLAPRHPERFNEVASWLQHKKISFSRWEDPVHCGQVLLVDAMGKLPTCYANSRLAISGGSYISHIGGHNVIEPALYQVPVFFGPHMYGQKELAERSMSFGAGKQVPLEQLRAAVDHFFSDPEEERRMKAAAAELILSGKGAAERTADVVFGGENNKSL